MKQTIPTLVLVPDELLRAGLLRILVGTRYKAVEIKGGWDGARDSGKSVPPLVILFMLGGGAEPVPSAKEIGAMAERSKVVVLADRCEADACRAVVCAGASAYLPRSISADTLLHVLDLVQSGEVVFPGALASGVLGCGQSQTLTTNTTMAATEALRQPAGDGRLSSREIEILQRLVHGESNKQISRQLTISETTVKVHIKAVLRKLRVCNRTQAAIWGLEHLVRRPDADVAAQPPAATKAPTAPTVLRPVAVTAPPGVAPPPTAQRAMAAAVRTS